MSGLFHALASLALAAAVLPLGAAVAEDRPPNILLFLGDNWAWPHAGVYGDPTAQTPVFDRIAREGVLLQHAFCPVPSCSPTRASLLTGRAAHQLGELANLWSAFPSRWMVFPEVLRRAGYEVGFCGKGWSPGKFEEFGWKENPVGRAYADFGEFLAQRDPSKPFFFWKGDICTALHQWRYEPEAWAGLDPASLRVPAELPGVEEVRLSLLAYYGAVGRMDAEAGRCLEALETRKLLENTAFFYTSDNGWQMPRGLANCYDTGTHVPMAVRWGKRIQPGSRVEAFVSLTDLAPTFLEIAGLQALPEMTGRSALGLLLGQAPAQARDQVFLERERHANVRRRDLSYPIRGVRNRDYLYLWNLRPERWPAGDPQPYFAVGAFGDVDGSRAKEYILAHAADPAIRPFFERSFGPRPAEELFDLRQDPGQLKNVAADPQYAGIRKELREQVESWMRESADPRVDQACDPWDRYPYYGPRAVDENGNLIPRRQVRAQAAP